MTAASLEALARALARLEPSVFTIEVVNQHLILWHGDGDFIYQTNGDIKVNDDILFGVVWRCAVAQGLRPSVMVSYKSDVLAFCVGTDPTLNVFEARAVTPGVALALAYCDARGDKVSL